MPLSALGPSTESWFVDERVDHGDAVALRCPSDPTFRWGNLLLLAAPMTSGSRATWESRFAEAFADLPDVLHTTFAWSGDDGAMAELEAAGYESDRNVVRVAGPGELAEPSRSPAGFALRQVGNEDWPTVLALQTSDGQGEEPEAYREHRSRRAAFYRRVASGVRRDLRGGWYLAELDGEPAGSMGVYVRDGLGRFQFVHVAPELRRQGVATAMVHAVAREGFERWGARRLVIMGDEGSAADGIYARLGFRAVERYAGACRKEPGQRPRG